MAYRYVEKIHPFNLSPESLDWYLAKGWYRMGRNIFTTHFLCFQQQLFSAIWIRIDLQDFSFSKRQRKLLRRNEKLFNTRVAYRRFTQEKEILYSRYADSFNGRLSPTLRDSLEDYDEQSIFNTMETSVRDRRTNELVAASYFDLGSSSAASILGIYEPSLTKHSLGYFTMLLEVQFCLDHGIRYYYPGYVVPGYERFDYKLRLGKSEYYDLKTDDWLAYDNFVSSEGPVELQSSKLTELSSALKTLNITNELAIYPLFEARLYHLWQAEYLNYPYLLLLNGRPEQGKEWILAAYDTFTDEYRVISAQSLEELRYLFSESYLMSFPESGYVRRLLQQNQLLFQHTDKETTSQYIQNLLQS